MRTKINIKYLRTKVINNTFVPSYEGTNEGKRYTFIRSYKIFWISIKQIYEICSLNLKFY